MGKNEYCLISKSYKDIHRHHKYREREQISYHNNIINIHDIYTVDLADIQTVDLADICYKANLADIDYKADLADIH